MKKLVKDKTNYLQDMLAGMQVSSDSIEVISDTVVVKKEKKQQGPTLVSGGGSGHEPAHAGFVAQGMLDAAVCGEIFTSPTPDKILNAIKAVDNGDGVLLIVKNYAGDVMNFEMAQDMAKMEDINVAMVVVKDDIAVDEEAQRRGVAGTVLVHKYAGYLAEQGENLDNIQQKVQQFIESIKTIGMALTAPLVPSTGKYGFDIEEDEIEIGIGIHGERGISKEQIAPVDEIVDKLTSELVKEIADKELIVMINGMGGTPISELDIVTKYVAENLSNRGKNVKHWIVGEYMTSLDMQGFSITLAPYSEEVKTALKAPTASRYFE
ncbi:dihydroxyacetone kinase subunit DhaK [Staphylococcus kloosii]|uniref:Dihydroxyacetone kinase n=1 Tax=Staphylococcus kloosii TaxID=29384 RepID=A0A151A7H8_9STAP|nr:dihydroxyacetone kinase subunit DhaK [Staphylococcus kloosii]KYH15185.1 dihydroxyacetone kinase [Staphylococcus kloosii]MBF7022797.1 dihydroxyacetone kinase subunit DhaK [Staphylococcus kloosii]